jgi:4-amino-4-deoxy-L-arabinose transferase-like glycosyltransferase
MIVIVGAGSAPSRRSWLLLIGGLLFLLTFALGSRGLNEPDEGRYANIARAMVLTGDWWEPRMTGFGHYDKPPLIYWTTAASFRLFGFNEWAARVPSLLGAILALSGLGWAAWRLYGARVAWLAVLICGTSVQFCALGHVLSPDMLLTGWCAMAIGAWSECRRRNGAWGFWLLSLLFWTLAWWTKATPALIPLAGLAVGTWLRGDAAGRKALKLWLLLPGILMLGSPWYLSMLHRFPDLHDFFFKRELAGRMAGRFHERRGPLLYYIPVSLAGWLPWWPLAAWVAWTKRKTLFLRSDGSALWRQRIGLEGWIVATGLLIFSLAASKLPTYTLTLAPWAALFLSRLIYRLPVPEDRPAWHHPAIAMAAGGFAAVIVVAGAIAAPRLESSLGVNSSVRQVCAFVKAHPADRVEIDRYCQGMEFYLDNRRLRYVLRNPHLQERDSDPGLRPEMFVEPAVWLGKVPGEPLKEGEERWLVHFRKLKTSAFKRAELLASAKWKRIGSFELLRVKAVDGKLAPINHD